MNTAEQTFNPKIQKLRQMQGLSLEEKISATKRRIREWYEHFEGEVYVSFSGGADSTVLLDLVRQEYPDVEAVFANTGLEYPEIVRFVKSRENVKIIKPKMSFKEVLKKYGYPVVSKEVSTYVCELGGTKSERLRNIRLYGSINGSYKLPEKWRFLLDAPFKISSSCCRVLKKDPMANYQKASGKNPYIGVQAEESRLRLNSYVRYSCNAFRLKTPQSRPMMFWRKNDTLQYLRRTGTAYCREIYGDIVERTDGSLEFTRADRTGCTFCLFGCHMDKGLNRIQRLKSTHPQLWRYVIDELGYKDVMAYLGLPYDTDGEIFKGFSNPGREQEGA